MLSVCFRYSKSREEAEDTLMEGFLKVFENISLFRKQGSLEGWIRKIMVNTALEKYRKLKNEKVTVCLHEMREPEVQSEDILSHLGAKELMRMIRKLPARYQMVFNLYVFEGMKHREIAALLGIAEGTSKSNFSDGKLILQRAVTNSLKVAKQKY